MKGKFRFFAKIVMVVLLWGCSTGNSGLDTDTPSLKKAMEPFFDMGTTLNREQVTLPQEDVLELVKHHFNVVTAENKMKWESIQPMEGLFYFEPTDQFVEFALENDMKIIGHTLVWHSQTPDWVFEDEEGNPADRDLLIERMRKHIFTLVGRYRGKVYGWDVVNEAVLDDGSMRDSPWREIIGDEYIQLAFEFAAQADPDARLYYNDYSLPNEPKREGVVRLVSQLQEKGVRIDGIGMQGHYHLDYPDLADLENSISAFANLGVELMITELDINVLPMPDLNMVGAEISTDFSYDKRYNPYGEQLPDSVQQQLARRYAQLFEVFIRNHTSISRVTFWGVHDGQSWLNNWPVRGRQNHPLLFDRELRPKPAFYEVLRVEEKFSPDN